MDLLKDRKNSHIDICLKDSVDYSGAAQSSFSQFRFEHDALPEVDKKSIDLSITLFGKKLAAPLIIGAMTGGTDKALEINQRLAVAAEHCGVGMALGSQRKMLEDNSVTRSYDVRKFAPRLPLLFGNLGAVQLNYGVGLKEVQKLIDLVSCDAFNFHLNPLQEAIQPEGDTNFSGLVSKLQNMVPRLSVPCLFKEVGSGISEATALKIRSIPVAGVETAGSGGTSWSKIESLRTQNSIQKSTGELFAQWGVPTAESVQICRKVLSDKVVIASGGIRNGIEIAKAIALGADAAATALPILKAAEKSVEAAEEKILELIEQLRTAMFVTGCKNIADLKKTKLVRATDFTAI